MSTTPFHSKIDVIHGIILARMKVLFHRSPNEARVEPTLSMDTMLTLQPHPLSSASRFLDLYWIANNNWGRLAVQDKSTFGGCPRQALRDVRLLPRPDLPIAPARLSKTHQPGT